MTRPAIVGRLGHAPNLAKLFGAGVSQITPLIRILVPIESNRSMAGKATRSPDRFRDFALKRVQCDAVVVRADYGTWKRRKM